ncbi:B12-binding domain-containing radical SAM protein [Candidatus Woesearchaeota archaeon]|nr:B12-binding domain-containing radical SAM protein [Candidatus Woesearchaeota archaeon]
MTPPTEAAVKYDESDDSLTGMTQYNLSEHDGKKCCNSLSDCDSQCKDHVKDDGLSPKTKSLKSKFLQSKVPARVLFIQDVWYPLQGVMNLSASLKLAGHTPDVAVGDDQHILDEISKFKPHIVAMSSMTAYRSFMLRMTKEIKNRKWPCLTVVGGFDSSFFPEIIDQVPEIDVLCRGEGNDAMVELATKLVAGEDYSEIKNLWVRKGDTIVKNPLAPFIDMNEKPFDDHAVYRNKYQYFRDIEFVQVMAGRGCPYRCAYCFNHKYQEMYLSVSKRYPSLRDPEIVVNEVEYLKNKYGYKTIFFNDSTLGYNKEWLIEFCRQYKERGVNIPFTINMCANEVSEDVAKALGDTKFCYLVRIGLEHGNEKFRKNVLRKNVTNQQLIDATNRLGENGVPVSYQFMMGLPGETFEMAEETLQFASTISRKDSIRAVNIFKPFPKLDLADYGVAIGQYDPNDIGAEDAMGAIGTRDSTLNDCFRRDSEGKKIVKLARWAHVYMNFPFTRPLIRKVFVNLPDNWMYKKVWYYTDIFYTSRHHINASPKYILKFITKHLFKPVR